MWVGVKTEIATFGPSRWKNRLPENGLPENISNEIGADKRNIFNRVQIVNASVQNMTALRNPADSVLSSRASQHRFDIEE